MDWNILISILTQLGTLVTIILVYLTLREMRNQRIASQRPDLIILDASVTGCADNSPFDERLSLPGFWSVNKKIEDMNEFTDKWIIGGIKLYNVGFGVAKNIKVRWTMEYDETIQQMREYCYENSLPLVIQIDDKGIELFEFGHLRYSIGLSSIETDSHDFLMPISVTPEGLETHVPSTLVHLSALNVYLQMQYLRDGRKESSGIIPSRFHGYFLKMELQYDDVENSHYFEEFDVRFTVGIATIDSEEEDTFGKQLLSGQFYFKSMRKRKTAISTKAKEGLKNIKERTFAINADDIRK